MRPNDWRGGARRLVALSAFLLLGAVPALAQTGTANGMTGLKLSGDKPIQIESDKLEVRQEENVAIFTGNVSVVQGPTLVKAGKMTVYYINKDKDKTGSGSGDQANAAPAPGSASIDHLELDDQVYIKSNDQIGTGDRGTFDMKTEIFVLTGKKVVLSQGANVLVGCKLTAYMKTGLAEVEGCAGGTGKGRVSMSLDPRSQQGAQ
jgi:lipopolysaccharide export system protein LptA